MVFVNRFAQATPWLHPVLAGYAASGVLLFAVLLLAGWWRARQRAHAMPAASWAPLGVLLAVAVNQPIVAAFAEPRPYTRLSGVLVLVTRGTDPSCPSDHATMAGAAAVGLWLIERRSGLLAGPAALLTCFARVYVGAHYPRGFAALAASTPAARLGQTMGAAELGRELGDAGGPLLVAAVASAVGLAYGFGALAILLALGAALAVTRRATPADTTP